MKKRLILILFLLLITGCTNDISKDTNNTPNEILQKESNEESEQMNEIKIIIDSNSYVLKLEDNDTTKEFIQLLPKEFNMNELNGNEKYVYLDSSLTSNPSNIKSIKTGDVMLYGDDCLVIFYKSFDTSYSYTKIGHIDNLPNLGNGKLKVRFEK